MFSDCMNPIVYDKIRSLKKHLVHKHNLTIKVEYGPYLK